MKDDATYIAIPKWAANVGAFVLVLFIPWMGWTTVSIERLKTDMGYVTPYIKAKLSVQTAHEIHRPHSEDR